MVNRQKLFFVFACLVLLVVWIDLPVQADGDSHIDTDSAKVVKTLRRLVDAYFESGRTIVATKRAEDYINQCNWYLAKNPAFLREKARAYMMMDKTNAYIKTLQQIPLKYLKDSGMPG